MPRPPAIEYQYADVFDKILCMINKADLDATWIAEVEASIPIWQSEWDAKGSKLLQAATELVGKPFRHASYIASVYLYQRFPSMSHPLILSVGNWIEATRTAEWPPLPETLRISTTFHELLHIYLVEIVGQSELPLKREYAAEQGKTKAHLHLDALLQSAYEKAGFSADLELIRRFDASYDRELREYARAWEIVKERGAEPFLADLRLAKG